MHKAICPSCFQSLLENTRHFLCVHFAIVNSNIKKCQHDVFGFSGKVKN